ncbi:EamA family transporter [Gulosibacter molinativorax]|uniref:EamA domain-containing protein n=1 Tax=Gulosibacter molinativorax TaxID=256821 RepID=A0ABT7CBB1_9MICO|nr:EamA family transporter [Gulosibacter molinativorax]MDJ1372491.1 hypothetical protein [Gulosibacter molinativorax]QUY61932.1 Drug/metabolite transporter (DMT) superfamily permease [Gulosibacter molinativorax]
MRKRQTTVTEAATRHSAGPRRQAEGLALMMASPAASQTGAAFGAMAFPVLGPVGVVAIRQLLTTAVLSSLVPYTADLQALRRVTPSVFATFTSSHPVWAAIAGWVILHQALEVREWLGIGLIVASNTVISLHTLRRVPQHVG